MGKKRELFIPDVDKLYSCDILVISNSISSSTLTPIIKEALALHMIKTTHPVSVIVNSNGGHSDMAIQLIEILLGMRRPIVTYGIGEICSAALLIFLAGDLRICTKRTPFLLHQYSWGKSGKYHELTAWRKIEDWYFKMTQEYIKERASNEAAKMCSEKSDVWLTPQQAKRIGIVHRIVSRINIPRAVGKPLKMED